MSFDYAGPGHGSLNARQREICEMQRWNLSRNSMSVTAPCSRQIEMEAPTAHTAMLVDYLVTTSGKATACLDLLVGAALVKVGEARLCCPGQRIQANTCRLSVFDSFCHVGKGVEETLAKATLASSIFCMDGSQRTGLVSCFLSRSTTASSAEKACTLGSFYQL